MSNNININTIGLNRIATIAPNVPTERKYVFTYLSTNHVSLWDTESAAKIVPEGRLVANIKIKTTTTYRVGSVITNVPANRKSALLFFSTYEASLRDAVFAALVPEGRLVGSLNNTRFSVPSERLVNIQHSESHRPWFYKKSWRILIFLFAALFTACKQKQHPIANASDKAYYTCSMHPQVHEEHAGNCPICSMKLIKVEFTSAPAGTAKNKIVLTAAQISLAGIQTDTVKEEYTGTEKTISGIVTNDENKTEELSAKIGGRIEHLFVRVPGEKINAGQAVYSIYSADLQESEKEYLLAKQQQKDLHNPDVDYAQLISAAQNKLLLWGLTQTQIRNLATSGKASPSIMVFSKISGTVSDIAVHEGDYVTEGMTILKTQALNILWVQAQVYASESSYFKLNETVNVSIPDLDSQVIPGKVEFINPELSDNSKIDLVRISISNNNGFIRPGIQANIAINNGGKRLLAVPASAIISGGSGNTVWVRNNDGSFSMRSVNLGEGNNSFVAILSGLNAGDVVVSQGAYLLNSEYIFKNGDDQAAMAGMKM